MRRSVIKNFLRQVDFSDDFEPIANLIFDDLITLLSYVHSRRAHCEPDYRFSFTHELHLIDEMWHSFILHTKYYTDYCYEQFGEIIHHLPEQSEPMELSAHSEQTKLSELPDAGDPVALLPNENSQSIKILEKQIADLKVALGDAYTNRIFFIYPRIFSLKESNHA